MTVSHFTRLMCLAILGWFIVDLFTAERYVPLIFLLAVFTHILFTPIPDGEE